MSAKFSKGQKVMVESIEETQSSPRDAGLESYVGKCAEVSNFYELNVGAKSFYIYTLKIDGAKDSDIVVHEDEISACLG